jgi:hypothetical protein
MFLFEYSLIKWADESIRKLATTQTCKSIQRRHLLHPSAITLLIVEPVYSICITRNTNIIMAEVFL